MTTYPSLRDIEISWRASGSGVCVLVEGETELEDAWFYNTWFGDRAREITFFPQDGWQKIVTAVASLRTRLGRRRVYGIIDRDFAGPPTYPPVPTDGILRTSKYTLENYLLDPECWYRYIRPHGRRTPKPGWSTPDEAQATIEGLYRECLPLSAYNWTLQQARSLDEAAFHRLREDDRKYKEHPKALDNMGDVEAHLRGLQKQMGLSADLGQVYADRLAYLQTLTLADWEGVVSGKYVLRLLRERFPLRLSGNQAWDDVLGAYVDGCPDPHPDLVNLVELILQDAQK